MYCRNCGNKILDIDNFCSKCGFQITDNVTYSDAKFNDSKISNNSRRLPMNWFKFWKYIRFPLSVILSSANIAYYLIAYDLELDLNNIFLFLIDVTSLLLMYITYYNFDINNQKGYKLLMVWLFFELFYYSFSSALRISSEMYSTLREFAICFFTALVLLGLVWTLPNYMYFKKRKCCFNN